MAQFSPIELQPGADMNMLMQAVNANFRQVAESNRTNIITDESGNKRIIIGKMPDGTYGLLIMKPGYDALELFDG